MSDLLAYTECLALPEAKKILASIKKAGKNGVWKDWSGAGGSKSECSIEGVDRSKLTELPLPEFCTYMSIYSGSVKRKKCDAFDTTVLGGNTCVLPEFGMSTNISYCIFVKTLGAFVLISLVKESGMLYFGRMFNYCCEFNVKWATHNLKPDIEVPEDFRDKTPTALEIEAFFADLWRKYELPDGSSVGWLETRKFEGLELGYSIEVEHFGEIQQLVHRMAGDLISESPCEEYVVRSYAFVQDHSESKDEIKNVTGLAKDLLRSVSEHNTYESYEVSYSYLTSRSWKDLEKARKKWKKPVVEQLGTATLETGAVAQVRVVTEKDGYVFYLDFENDDDLIKFYHSKLFKKAKWHSGAE